MAAAASGRVRGRSALARTLSAARALAPFYAANSLTLARLVATPAIVVLLLGGRPEPAFWLFVAAAVTDAVDGYIAKRFNAESPLGRFLDPLADKLLVGATVLTLAVLGAAPLWLAVLIVARDVGLAIGSSLVRRRRGFRIEPLVIGKASTAVQLVYLGAAIAASGVLAVAPAVAAALLPVAALMTLLSAVAYLGVLAAHWRTGATGR